MYKIMIFFLLLVAIESLKAQKKSDSTVVKGVQSDTSFKQLEEVVISTGYQQLPKERATGSFSKISNEDFNRQVSSDLLSRLDGSATGISFNGKKYGTLLDVVIRGKATFSDYRPLIVVDNFPYEGDLNNLNPQDVESITILKDAAAASIWGASAGNGVIIITTKRGSFNQRPQVQLQINATQGQKPDFSAREEMSVHDYVEFETILFGKGMYNGLEQSIGKQALSPAAEIMIANRDGLINDDEMNAKLSSLAAKPSITEDYKHFFYQKPVTQRYALNVSGGSSHHNYYLSFGHDKIGQELRGNRNVRNTLNFKNVFTPLKNLSINASIVFTQYNMRKTTELENSAYPYESLTDEQGGHLPVTKDYRISLINNAEQSGLLNWEYKPLDELGKLDYSARRTHLLVNTGVSYKFLKDFSLDLFYQWEKENSNDRNREDKDIYSVRSIVNGFSQVNGSSVTRPIPYGDILTQGSGMMSANSGRLQLSYSKKWKTHSLIAIAGLEAREYNRAGESTVTYGYTEEGVTSTPVDYLTFYPQSYNPNIRNSIPYGTSFTGGVNRFASAYGNAAYTYDNRISISASVRKDGANLFGVKTNQKWRPLWSGGISWLISEEGFYSVGWMPYLKTRLTYGYAGNVGSGSAYMTAYYGISSLTKLRVATISTPPNPGLKWEKQGLVNYGIDFKLFNNVISGSIDLFGKKGTDLILKAPLDPTTGYFTGLLYSVTRNYACMNAKGVESELNTLNLHGDFKWQTRFLFSYTKSKIVKVDGEPTISSYLSGSAIPGNSPGEIFSYRWGGLDPANGNPIGIIDDKPVTSYSQINSLAKPEDLIRNGPADPVIYGSLGNTFSWRNLTLSVNFLYRMGYYFRRNSFVFGVGNNHKDFASRWRRPGDELLTSVPSIPLSFDPSRNYFYSNSEVLVEKGDHVRLQYINLSYALSEALVRKLRMQNANIYVNLANGGIVWRANKKHIDPDYPGMSAPVSVTIGIRTDF